jgi:hypothetical protein
MKTHPNEIVNAIVTKMHDWKGTEVGECFHPGLTKREYFAAMALQGLLADIVNIKTKSSEKVTEMAVELADELIKELNKNEN